MQPKQMYLYISTLLVTASVTANTIHLPLYSTQSLHKKLGSVEFKDTDYGLLITPNLKGLPPGQKGFHVHQANSCGNHGMDAGGHFDPKATKSHQGPYGEGHLGDLPTLYVNPKGVASQPTLAPRLTTNDLSAHTLMVHQDGDNYSDTPPLGGGGARIACGIFPNPKTENKKTENKSHDDTA